MRTVLHTEASPGLGGQEIRTLTEARWIAERGWRVLLACQPHGRLLAEARARGVECYPVSMRGPWDVLGLTALLRLVRAERASLVHTHSSIDGWLGGMAARVARVPVVRTRHVSIPIRRGWNPVYTALADRVLTSGEAIRQMVVGAGVPAARVLAIPAGVQLADFGSAGAGPAVRAELELGTGPVVGSVAMFRASKGHRALLEAVALVRARRPAVRLVLVGDGIRRAWVQGLAAEMGLDGAVRFTGFRDDVPALLAAMDCFVLASTRTEGVPQSLLQAFAARVPVVATSVGGIPEVVRDGQTGLLVPPDDPPALAAAIERVLADAESAAARARTARAMVEERFTHVSAIDRLLGVYEELVAPR